MLLSIIIPCYNSGSFLRNTLNKLLSQNLNSCEVILVNDGSTDNTITIMNVFKHRFDNMIIIDQPNQGVSAARNNGIHKAHGKFVFFLDSDDELTEDAIDYIKQSINLHPDCALFGFGYKVKRDNSIIVNNCNCLAEEEMSGLMTLKQLLQGKLRLNICSLAISKTLLTKKNIYFERGQKIGEDLLFICKLLPSVDIFRYSAKHCFTYVLRDNSVTGRDTKFSVVNMESLLYLRPYLLSLSTQIPSLRNDVNYFLLLRWGRCFLSYMKSSTRDQIINQCLIEYGKIRFSPNYTGNIRMWIVMKLTALIPLRMILSLFK